MCWTSTALRYSRCVWLCSRSLGGNVLPAPTARTAPGSLEQHPSTAGWGLPHEPEEQKKTQHHFLFHLSCRKMALSNSALTL